MNRVILAPEYFPFTNKGKPISSADIYVGEPDTDPEVVGNQKTLSVLEEDGSVTAASQVDVNVAGEVSTTEEFGNMQNIFAFLILVFVVIVGGYLYGKKDVGGKKVYY